MSQSVNGSEELTNQLLNIIETANVSAEEKQLYRNLFRNLATHQNSQIEKLRGEVRKSICEFEHSKESFGDIVVALLPKNKTLCGFRQVHDFSHMSRIDDSLDENEVGEEFIGAFFWCDYDRFLDIVDSGFQREYDVCVELKSGRSIRTKCSFRISYAYITEEKLLQMTASQYSIERPLIYSPYSRRFAKIVFAEKISVSQVTALHFPSLENEIIATTVDYALMWNVEITNRKVPELPFPGEITTDILHNSGNFTANEYVIPGVIPNYKSKYSCKPNEYIIFDGVGARRLAIARNLKANILYVLYDGHAKIEPVRRLEVHEVTNSESDIYELIDRGLAHINSFGNTLFLKKRLRSYADIVYALGAFRENNYKILIDESVEILHDYPKECVTEYQNEHRYYKYPTDKRLCEEPDRSVHRKNAVFCRLTFRGSDRFIPDYARYVLSYMNEMYPEFYWVGRCED